MGRVRRGFSGGRGSSPELPKRRVAMPFSPQKENRLDSRPTFRQELKNLWDNYVYYSTVHGVIYAGSTNSSATEKLVWCVALLGSCILCPYLCAQTVFSDAFADGTNTVITDPYLAPTSFAFPALSLCPLNKIRRRVGERLLLEHLGISPTDMNSSVRSSLNAVMRSFSFLEMPDLSNIKISLSLISPLRFALQTLNVTDFMIKALPTCEDLFDKCYWHEIEEDCCQMLHLQQSELGFCYSFNSLTAVRSVKCHAYSTYSSSTNAISSTMAPECLLRKTSSYGMGSAALIFLKELHDEDILHYRSMRGLVVCVQFACLILNLREMVIKVGGLVITLGNWNLALAGLQTSFAIIEKVSLSPQVCVHHNLDMPTPAAGHLLINRKSMFLHIGIKIAYTTVDSEVLALPIRRRKCLAAGEVDGWLVHAYSQQTCQLECKLDYLLKECKCVPYMFAREGYPPCTTNQLDCLTGLDVIRLVLPPYGFPDDAVPRRGLNCSRCFPSCQVVSYSLQRRPMRGGSKGGADVRLTRAGAVAVHISAGDSAQIYQASLRYDTAKSNTVVGSVAGLFLGVSIVSVVEAAYYLLKFVALLGLHALQLGWLRPLRERVDRLRGRYGGLGIRSFFVRSKSVVPSNKVPERPRLLQPEYVQYF